MNTSKTDQVKQLIDQGLKSLVENLEGGINHRVFSLRCFSSVADANHDVSR